MSLFKKSDNAQAYLKAGFMGFAGSGKTTSATALAIGLVQLMREKDIQLGGKPIMFLDTETGSDWVQPAVTKAGIELQVARTRAFKDLRTAVTEAEKGASVLLIDSITHFWTELTDSYTKTRKRGQLEFSDWAYLKGEWRKFTDQFVNSQLHIVMCGRAGYEYDHFTDEAGKKKIEKSGIKMKAEGETGYEPSLLVLMEREMDLDSKKVYRTAHILKDRSGLIDGKAFRNPTFKNFLPHVTFLNLGGKHEGFDATRTSDDTIEPDKPMGDRNGIRRKIVIDELGVLLEEHGLGGTSGDAKQKRAAALRKHFKTVSKTEIEELMPLADLQANFDSLHRELTGKPSAYGVRDDRAAEAEANIEADEIPV